MNINTRMDFINNLPDEEILGSFWYIDIEDLSVEDSSVLNNIKVANYSLADGIADKYIHSVNIPMTSIEYEKTSWGQISAKEAKREDSFDITFTSNVKADILRFCQDWLDSVFDFDKFVFKRDWRQQAKTFRVVCFRPFSKRSSNLALNALSSSFSNVIGYKNAIESTVNKMKTLIGKSSNIPTSDNMNCVISAIYEMEYVYPSKFEDISFSDEDSDRKEFTLSCECAKITKIYGQSNVNKQVNLGNINL